MRSSLGKRLNSRCLTAQIATKPLSDHLADGGQNGRKKVEIDTYDASIVAALTTWAKEGGTRRGKHLE